MENKQINITDSAVKKILSLTANEVDGIKLRLSVSGGGCSGFQYLIELGQPKDDDLILEKSGEKVLIDSVSLPFLTNAIIDFSDEIIGARFIINNPNATSSCGCGTSFSL